MANVGSSLCKVNITRFRTMHLKPFAVAVIVGVTVLVLEICRTYIVPVKSFDVINFKTNSDVVSTDANQCPGVLSHMTRGKWVSRPLTNSEEEEIGGFLGHVQEEINIPPGYQRQDGRCGNITYTSSPFRAVCNPRGETPCCLDGWCVSRDISECACTNCYDLRARRHAEYSTWVPTDERCAVPEITQMEACRILNGSRLSFYGDSMVRHVYTAMLLMLSGDVQFGALALGTTPEIRRKCKGMLMFTEKVCRLHLDYHVTACNGRVRLSCIYAFSSYHGYKLRSEVLKESLPKSLAVVGIGIHDSYNTGRTIDNYIEPLVYSLHRREAQWPRLLWAEPHAPGLLKSPTHTQQSSEQVQLFNAKMERYLWYRNVPIFRTFELTQNMTSFDGQHFGRGMNLMKARLIISYIRELQNSGAWS